MRNFLLLLFLIYITTLNLVHADKLIQAVGTDDIVMSASSTTALKVKAAGNIEFSQLSASCVPWIDSNKYLSCHATVSATELGYLSNVTSDIQGQFNIRSASSTTFTGAGLTEGSVLFASATSPDVREDNSNFFWDNSNGRLGLGTSSPSSTLHILGGDVRLGDQKEFRFYDADNSNYVALKSPTTIGADVTLTLPDNDGTASQALITDGNGALSWATIGGADGYHEGMKVSRTATSTLEVSVGIVFINGSITTISSVTSITSAFSASTTYYLYGTTSSSASNLVLSATTTAPGDNGEDGVSNKVLAKFRTDGSSEIELDNVGQWIINRFIGHGASIFLHTANSYGSSSNKIRRWTTTVSTLGGDIIYSDSETMGGLFTIATGGEGWYYGSYSGDTNALAAIGISLNSTELTMAISAIADKDRLCIESVPASGASANCSFLLYLAAGDIVRVHTNGAASNAPDRESFIMTKVEVR